MMEQGGTPVRFNAIIIPGGGHSAPWLGWSGGQYREWTIKLS